MILTTEEERLVKCFMDYCSQHNLGGYTVINDLKGICNDKIISPLGYVRLDSMLFTINWNKMGGSFTPYQSGSLVIIIRRALEEFELYAPDNKLIASTTNNLGVNKEVHLPEVNF